jgi:hypothetical protein
MDGNLEKRKDFIVKYFRERGLEPYVIYEIIQYLAHSVFFDPGLSAFEIKEELYKTRLPSVELEEELIQKVKECLIIEGRKGLEYRFGKGFSYLKHQNNQIDE